MGFGYGFRFGPMLIGTFVNMILYGVRRPWVCFGMTLRLDVGVADSHHAGEFIAQVLSAL